MTASDSRKVQKIVIEVDPIQVPCGYESYFELTRDGKGRIESARMQKNALYFGMQRANGAKGGRPRKNKS